MTITNQKRTPELVTDLERKWLELLRAAMSATSISDQIVFERVTVKPDRVYAERALETIYCGGARG